MTGRVFGRLTVVKRGPDRVFSGLKRVFWTCRCDCGNSTDVSGTSLRSGRTTSCGCYLRDIVGARNRRHGLCRTSIYNIWVGIKARCLNPKVACYPRYGGAGVTICDRWRDSFDAFLEDMGNRPAGMTIDRIDNSRGYEPGNCRWATPAEQRRNNRRIVLVNGMPLKDYAALRGVNYKSLHNAMQRGRDPVAVADAWVAAKG